MQTDHGFCWKNHHLLAAQLVTLSLCLAAASIIIRQFLFPLRGKSRRWQTHFFWWLLCLNPPCSGGGGSHCPGWQVYWSRSSAGRPLPTQSGSWHSPRLLSKHPLRACTEVPRSRNRRAGREILRILYTRPLSLASATCLFFFSS